jgi:uncharacterized protein with HEPN domain
LTDLRLDDYLEHIETAALRALEFVSSLSREEFLLDVKTQHAVAMSFAIIGEAAARISQASPQFVADTPMIGWREMRGMRHHLVHGYFSIDYGIVWDTVQNELPRLVAELSVLRATRQSSEP